MSKHILMALALNAASVAAIACGAWLAVSGVDEWGWMLVVAVFLHTTPERGSDE